MRLKVDVIVTQGIPAATAAKNATPTIPIVMAISGDPVATGLVTSFARPGGNITGSSFFLPELNAKRVELLKEAVPRATRMAALAHPDNPAMTSVLKAMESVANSLKVEFQAVEVRGPEEFSGAFSAMAKRRVDAVAVIEDGMLLANARQIADLAVKAPAPDDRLQGVRGRGWPAGVRRELPGNLAPGRRLRRQDPQGRETRRAPIEQATRFEFVVNMRTAKVLGLTIPPSILVRADEVIE